jgi:ps3 protein 14 family transcriptional regulator
MNLIVSYRKMTGKNQTYFANVLGISLNSYANKEKGRTQFTQKEMELFYREVKKYIKNISVEDIFFSQELQKITT